MSVERKKIKRIQRRKLRVRAGIKKRSDLPRVAVFRSLRYMYAQIIDDVSQKTVASCSSLELKSARGDKKEIAKAVGIELAQRAKKEGIGAVVFDRGSFLYHGRIKAVADGLREGGLQL